MPFSAATSSARRKDKVLPVSSTLCSPLRAARTLGSEHVDNLADDVTDDAVDEVADRPVLFERGVPVVLGAVRVGLRACTLLSTTRSATARRVHRGGAAGPQVSQHARALESLHNQHHTAAVAHQTRPDHQQPCS